jgi:hypothetical protein
VHNENVSNAWRANEIIAAVKKLRSPPLGARVRPVVPPEGPSAGASVKAQLWGARQADVSSVLAVSGARSGVPAAPGLPQMEHASALRG